MRNYLAWFSKPVRFYPYDSMVMSTIIEIDGGYIHPKELDRKDQRIVDYIRDIFTKAHNLNRSQNGATTRSDNKTVIEMSDGNHSIFLGYYDGKWSVGLGVWQMTKDRSIDLSDISEEQFENLSK